MLNPEFVPNASAYPQVYDLLNRLLTDVQAILGNSFVGMYLYGSLALGDFGPDSDIDFLVVTTHELGEEAVTHLTTMHDRIAVSGLARAQHLEGAYIPREALRRYDPANARHPHIDRGPGERLSVQQHDSDWVVQRFVLREYGVTLAGPPIRSLIDPIAIDDLKRAVLKMLFEWFAPMIEDPTLLLRPGYQGYAILTMCRMLYTIRNDAVVSKPVAARWAKAELGTRWCVLIDKAIASQITDADLPDTLDLFRLTVERGHRADPDA